MQLPIDLSVVPSPEDRRILQDLVEALRDWRLKIRMMVRGTRIGTTTIRFFGDLEDIPGAGPPGCVPPLSRLSPARRTLVEMTRAIARGNWETAWREEHPEDLSRYATDVSGNPQPQWQSTAPPRWPGDEPAERDDDPYDNPPDDDPPLDIAGWVARQAEQWAQIQATTEMLRTLPLPLDPAFGKFEIPKLGYDPNYVFPPLRLDNIGVPTREQILAAAALPPFSLDRLLADVAPPSFAQTNRKTEDDGPMAVPFREVDISPSVMPVPDKAASTAAVTNAFVTALGSSPDYNDWSGGSSQDAAQALTGGDRSSAWNAVVGGHDQTPVSEQLPAVPISIPALSENDIAMPAPTADQLAPLASLDLGLGSTSDQAGASVSDAVGGGYWQDGKRPFGGTDDGDASSLPSAPLSIADADIQISPIDVGDLTASLPQINVAPSAPSPNLQPLWKVRLQGVFDLQEGRLPPREAFQSQEDYEHYRDVLAAGAAGVASRVTSPSPNMREKANSTEGMYIEPGTNQVEISPDRLEADHIIPKKVIMQLPGFDKLTPEQQGDILNDPEITEGLPKTYNASKGAKLPEDFVTYKGEPLAQDYVAANAERQAVLLKYIQQRINNYLAINLAAKGEADDD